MAVVAETARRTISDAQAGCFDHCVGKKPETGLAGWGGRIRTSVWRNQNPLPYHLATPHRWDGATINAKENKGKAPGFWKR